MSTLLNCNCIHLQIAEILIDHGAQVNISDKTSKATPLHRAASRYVVMMVSTKNVEICRNF